MLLWQHKMTDFFLYMFMSNWTFTCFCFNFLRNRHKGNGAVIARCSQPAVGWLGWRSEEDERFMSAILDACAMDDPRKNKKSCHSNGYVKSEQYRVTDDQGLSEISFLFLSVFFSPFSFSFENKCTNNMYLIYLFRQ